MTGQDHYVSYTDHALLLMLRGASHDAVMQVLWLYPEAADARGLSRFHRRLTRGPLGRRIESSPLPFGRPRWVAGEPAPLVMDPAAIGIRSLYEWADRQVDLPLDPEHGPAWRLSATGMHGGATAVSLVISHCVADGTAALRALVAAIADDGAQPGHSWGDHRSGTAAVRADLRRLRSDLPEIRRALRALSGSVHSARGTGASPSPAEPPAAAGTVHLPTASLLVDLAEWDESAAARSGNRAALATAVAVHLGDHFHRERSGRVTLLVPVSRRRDDNLDGNAVGLARIAVPVSTAVGDLTGMRDLLRSGIATARAEKDPLGDLLPLVPFIPRRAIGRLADRAFGFTQDLPVSVSNMGVVPPDILRADGTPAQTLLFRGVDRHLPAEVLARRRGVLSVMVGAVGRTLSLTAVGCSPDGNTTGADLRRALGEAAADLGVTGTLV